MGTHEVLPNHALITKADGKKLIVLSQEEFQGKWSGNKSIVAIIIHKQISIQTGFIETRRRKPPVSKVRQSVALQHCRKSPSPSFNGSRAVVPLIWAL